MRVVTGRPPNYERIVAALGRPVIEVVYCWGEVIFNPSGKPLHPSTLAHERVHSEQQLALGPERWWERYLADQQFRLDQEVPAFQAQWRWLSGHLDRAGRRAALRQIAGQLSGGTYGHLLSRERAVALITSEAVLSAGSRATMPAL